MFLMISTMVYDNSENQLLNDSDYLTQPGDPIQGPHVLVAGKLSLHMFQNGSKREFVMFTKDISGYLPIQEEDFGRLCTGNWRSTTLEFPYRKIQEMIKDHLS
ncbi:hypothetical protein CS542_01645 [Pedobacter sp. IW39]|nr:hypothetical protein CS542_01645 [Pedobacter sp. IW39]